MGGILTKFFYLDQNVAAIAADSVNTIVFISNKNRIFTDEWKYNLHTF